MVYQSLVIFAVSFFAVALSPFVLVVLWLDDSEERRLDERIERYCDGEGGGT